MIFLLVFFVFAQDILWHAQEDRLHDGLRLYSHMVPNTKMVSVMFRYHLPDDIPDGAAHFVEHLMFSYRDEERTYDQILESMGGESQGRTDLAMMKLSVRIPIESWDDWVRLEKKRQEESCHQITDHIFESQRMVVVQEYMQGVALPERVHTQSFRRAVFGDRGIGRSVIGSIDDISDWNKDQICAHRNRIIAHVPVDVFVVGDIGEVDVSDDIRHIFSQHRLGEEADVEKFPSKIVQMETSGGTDSLYVVWPIPEPSHVDTRSLRYWMMMITHSRFGVLRKQGIQARGWMEYGLQEGYLLLQLQGKTSPDLEKTLRANMYGARGWGTIWMHMPLVSKVYHRSVIHSWKTLEGRLTWLEHCVQADIVSTCFSVDDSFSRMALDRAKKQWLRWEQASTLHVVSP